MGVVMEITYVMVIELNEFKPLKAFTTHAWNTGNAQYMWVTNIITNVKNLTKKML